MNGLDRTAFTNAGTLLDRLAAYIGKDQLGRIVADAGAGGGKIDPNNITLLCRALEAAARHGHCPRTAETLPKRILQYWDQSEIPADVARCMATWKIAGYDHVVFNDEQARDFIKGEYEGRHVQAFDTCNHPAMKSDLFRLGYLYRYGGIYVDSDDCYEGKGLDGLVEGGLFRLKTIALRSLPPGAAPVTQWTPSPDDRTAFNNNPIFCRAGDEILLRAFERATSTLLALGKRETYKLLKITGPTNLTLAVYITALDCIRSNTEFYFCPIIRWADIATTSTQLAYQTTDRNWRVYVRSGQQNR